MAKMKKRADGRYCKNVTLGRNDDGSLKRKMVYANTQKDLDLKVAELMLQVDRGVIIDDKNKTVDVWADEWLKAYNSHLKSNTIGKYKSVINRFIKSNFKDVRLKDLKQFQIQNILNNIAAQDTAKRFLIVIKKMLDAAVENDLVVKNVARDLIAPKYEVKEKSPITTEQINTIKNIEYEIQDICVFLIYSGLRISELINLTWQKVDLKNKKIKIDGDVKTKNSNRLVPLFEPAYEILKRYNNSRIKNIDADKDYVFLIDGAKRKLGILSDRRYKYCKILNFDFTFHQLRHTFITICYNAGIDVKQVQEWVGHASFNTTMDIYTHLSKENKKDNTDKLNEFLKSM